VDTATIHRLAILCKTYLVLGKIDDLFIFAGAEKEWRIRRETPTGTSERVDRFNAWIDGIKVKEPKKLDTILKKVVIELSKSLDVPEGERATLLDTLVELERQAAGAEGFQLEPLLATLARVLANDGLSREVAILISAEPRLDWLNHDNMAELDIYSLCLCIPFKLYAQIDSERQECEKAIAKRIPPLLLATPHEYINQVVIAPKLLADDNWRDKALAWLTGEKVNNQGRVRSDNVAPRTADGLQFRSEPEIHLYKALKALGISFAPLPVFVRGGQDYRRIEPDFVILKDGAVMVVEVDGDTFHRETPSEAHNRTTMLMHEGAHVERVNASQCDTPEKAAAYAKRLLQIIGKLKEARR
jgi:hypothetical protein